MARSHRMTPARRAALRKAQLASAKKRRKSGAVSSARKSISQRRQARSAQRTLNRTSPAVAKRKARRRKIARRTTTVLAVASVAGLYGAGVHSAYTKRINQKPTPPRALEPKYRRVPKGNANRVPHSANTLFKTNRKGTTLKTTHARQQYNARRRKNKPTTGINI